MNRWPWAGIIQGRIPSTQGGRPSRTNGWRGHQGCSMSQYPQKLQDLPDALPIEPEFKRLMFEGVS